MYSIIQAFGINYAENSSIIKQIKKPETGDTASSPSEGMDSVGSLDPAEGPQRKGGTVCATADTPRRGQGLMGARTQTPESCLCRPFSPHWKLFFPIIKTLLPLPGILFHQGLEQPSFVRTRGAHWGWSGKAGVRTGLSWSRQGCQGEGTAEPSGCQGHREPSLALVKAPGLLLLL